MATSVDDAEVTKLREEIASIKQEVAVLQEQLAEFDQLRQTVEDLTRQLGV